jgi:outer membrane protein assembly factor BamB
MSAERLIDELSERGLLSDRVMARLREKIASSERPLSAKAVAKFLVEKNHLTQRQATEALGSLLHGGEDVGRSDSVDPADDGSLALVDDDDREEDDAESSSIFAPFLTGKKRQEVDPGAVTEVGLNAARNTAQPANQRQKASADVDTNRGRFEQESVPQALRRGEPERPIENPTVSSATPLPLEKRSSAARSARKARDGRRSHRSKESAKDKNEWDSPLILLGGGALVLLVLCGATVAWLLNWESGDEKLRTAQDAVASGSYTQAISQYQEFLERFPRHRERSVARVQLAMARLRKATESSNYAAALDIAHEELDAIENEEKFALAHPELAALLPRIAAGLANEAEAAANLNDAAKLADQSNDALALVSNTKNIPKSLRDEGELEVVRETLARVRRKQESLQDLKSALDAMQQAITASDTQAAYARHAALVKQHPELAADATLLDMLQQTSAAEQAAIRFVREEHAAETGERPTPWVAALAVAHRRGNAAATATGGNGTACVRIDGALYGLDAATGRLLWRRPIGFSNGAWPTRIAADILIADGTHHELQRLEGATGRLLWRQAIGEKFAPPLVVDGQAFVAGESGRLYIVDLNSGVRTGFVEFAQPLRTSPTVDRQKQFLFIAADRYSLYTISLADFSCLGVHFLGHAGGSIGVPPAVVLDKLVVLENDGVATSRLQLLSFDTKGAIARQLAERRLTGLPVSAPLVAGRRVIVATDRGQIEVYDVGLNDSEEPLAVVATRDATGKEPVARHVATVDRNVWVGDTQLMKLSILPTGNRLRVDSIDNDFSGATFDHPFELLGNTLIHVHRPRKRSGAVVAATQTSDGRVLWQTDLAIPPVGTPIVDEVARSLTVASAEGYVFRFDEEAIRKRVQDQPLVTQTMPAELPPLTAAIDLGQGRAAFCAPESDRMLLFNPALGNRAAQWIKLASPLACNVTALSSEIVAPLVVGQVFLLSAADGSTVGMPFQPRLAPRTTLPYQPAGVVDAESRRFVITDGSENIYLLAATDAPQPHLAAITEAKVGPYPITSPLVVLGDMVVAVGDDSHLVRYRLPSLESVGETKLPAPVVWGPFAMTDSVLLATADNHLMLVSKEGEEKWRAPMEHGPLTGAPLATADGVLLAYRNGIVERRSAADGKVQATKDVEHPLSAGPIRFSQRLVLTAHDGTLLVVDQP